MCCHSVLDGRTDDSDRLDRSWRSVGQGEVPTSSATGRWSGWVCGSLSTKWINQQRPCGPQKGARCVTANPMQVMVVFWKQLRAGRTGPQELSFILLFLCKTRCQSLRHHLETSEPRAAMSSSKGLRPCPCPHWGRSPSGHWGPQTLGNPLPSGLVSLLPTSCWSEAHILPS